MTTAVALLSDAFGRIGDNVHRVLDGLDRGALIVRLDPQANSIGWLVWHLTRVQDDHVADVADTEQVWSAHGWADSFALPFDHDAIGYGQSSEQVGQVTAISAEQLGGYYDDVHGATSAYLHGLQDGDLDRVVDTRWDPAVTLGARLVSVVADDLQHIGQAAFIRGALERRA
jgi:hypothetical protein